MDTEGYKEYLCYDLRVADNTVQVYIEESKRFHAYFAQKKVQDITASMIYDYLDHRNADQDLEGRTMHRIISSLNNYFRYLQDEQVVEENPVEAIKRPKLPDSFPQVLAEEDIEKLLRSLETNNILDQRDRALFELIYSCGLRVSEVISLNMFHVFLDDDIIQVHGKRDRERLIPIVAETKYWLKQYIHNIRPQLASEPCEALFLGRRGKGLSRKGVWKRFHQLCQRNDITAHVHTLRHSYATHLVQNGADIRAVQALLGHASIATTEIYTHVAKKDLEATYQKYHPSEKEKSEIVY